MAVGITLNLAVLIYYKYTNFIVENINYVFETSHITTNIVLPIAISFFTFQQITYLVDSYKNQVNDKSFIRYVLFVTFFPQLIAGPIVHHKEMLQQFTRNLISNINITNITIGIVIFTIGLSKKVIFADRFAEFANPVFLAAQDGLPLDFFAAWIGALSYTLQLYFDFSGYADMAIGIALMFGIKLPLNFNSPYKALSIIEFWRRWHMTLSRFLRDYLYIPLGGNRKGKFRRYVNLLITMLLGGIWHGAGWTFLVWGALHGIYLCINHTWQKIAPCLPISKIPQYVMKPIYGFITFMAIVLGWVIFRADSLPTAGVFFDGMLGTNGVVIPAKYHTRMGDLANLFTQLGIQFEHGSLFKGTKQLQLIFSGLLIVWILPNTYSLLRNYQITTTDLKITPSKLAFSTNLFWLVFISILAIYSILDMEKINEFIYFQF